MPKEPTARASFTREERDLAVEMCRVGLARLQPFLSADYQARADGLLAKIERLPLARVREAGQTAPTRKRKQAEAAPVTAAPAAPLAAERPADPATTREMPEMPDILRNRHG